MSCLKSLKRMGGIPFTQVVSHLTHSLARFTHSLTHLASPHLTSPHLTSLAYSLAQSSLAHSLAHLAHSLTHLTSLHLTSPHLASLTHSLTHSLAHLTHSRTHSLTITTQRHRPLSKLNSSRKHNDAHFLWQGKPELRDYSASVTGGVQDMSPPT